MSRFARFRFLAVIVVTFASAISSLAAADGAVSTYPAGTPYILIGFAGGFVRHDNPLHGPVHLAQRIQSELPSGSSVQVFENRHRKAAYKTVLQLLDRNHDGFLSDLEKRRRESFSSAIVGVHRLQCRCLEISLVSEFPSS